MNPRTPGVREAVRGKGKRVSKAMAWAKRLEDARYCLNRIERDEVPNFFINDGSGTPAAYADEDGSPFFERVRGHWSKEDALRLAEWLIVTFGEDPTP